MAISTDELIAQLDEAATEAERDSEFEHTNGDAEHRALHLGEASAYRNIIQVLVLDKFLSMIEDSEVEFDAEVAPRAIEQ